MAQLRIKLLDATDAALRAGVAYTDTIGLLLAVVVSTATYAPDSRLLTDAEFDALLTSLYDQLCDALLVHDGMVKH